MESSSEENATTAVGQGEMSVNYKEYAAISMA